MCDHHPISMTASTDPHSAGRPVQTPATNDHGAMQSLLEALLLSRRPWARRQQPKAALQRSRSCTEAT